MTYIHNRFIKLLIILKYIIHPIENAKFECSKRNKKIMPTEV